MVEVEKWDPEALGPLDEAAVRRRFQPEGFYRISSSRHPAGTRVGGRSREVTRFVLEGDCRISGDGYEATLVPGDFARFPGGEYVLETTAGVHLVKVWRLPPELRVVPARED
ncbi:hypothetical protein HPC49_30795 [Pyxidicoccus fallax]|uniref:Uncharacterized protein n=1 Tax=Pyxidicoccus fallax TaxID=394095 RepID=A0A848LJ07_9BACT|nr:hypothetical protein [Pyxidicoccus fallax]NMO17709.1 hypothetical protein [Pyxidicoccus fallax]NPC82598.1 hypothetical protein [Pyxidicoccus fallax]